MHPLLCANALPTLQQKQINGLTKNLGVESPPALGQGPGPGSLGLWAQAMSEHMDIGGLWGPFAVSLFRGHMPMNKGCGQHLQGNQEQDIWAKLQPSKNELFLGACSAIASDASA